MSKVAVILAAATAGLGLVSLHLVKQLRDGEATIAELKAQVTALEEQRVTAVLAPPPAQPLELVAVPKEAPEPAVVGASMEASKPAPAAQTAPQMAPQIAKISEEQMRMMREHRERQRQLMQDPDYREAMRLQARNNFARQYPGVIQELGLDQQQADDFFGMLADQQMRMNELMSPLWETAGENSDPAATQDRHQEIQQTAADLQRDSEAEFVTRFGQDKLQAWKDYQSTMGMRYHLDHMRSTLAANGVPLNEDLSKPMLKALAEVQKAEIAEYNAAAKPGVATRGMGRLVAFGGVDSSTMERQIEQMKKRNQRMLEAISSYLTYEQRAAIEQEQQAQLKMQEAQMRVMRDRGDANATSWYVNGTPQIVPLQR